MLTSAIFFKAPQIIDSKCLANTPNSDLKKTGKTASFVAYGMYRKLKVTVSKLSYTKFPLITNTFIYIILYSCSFIILYLRIWRRFKISPNTKVNRRNWSYVGTIVQDLWQCSFFLSATDVDEDTFKPSFHLVVSLVTKAGLH
jgi:hypothetical protein